MELRFINEYKTVVNDPPTEISFLNLKSDTYLKFTGFNAFVLGCVIKKMTLKAIIASAAKEFQFELEDSSLRVMRSVKDLIHHGVIEKI